jgi:hypothetical protein
VTSAYVEEEQINASYTDNQQSRDRTKWTARHGDLQGASSSRVVQRMMPWMSNVGRWVEVMSGRTHSLAG